MTVAASSRMRCAGLHGPTKTIVIITPIGPLVLRQRADGTMVTEWSDDEAGANHDGHDPADVPGLLGEVADGLRRYMNGERITFEHVPLPVGTPFQQACWSACRKISPGETVSYRDLAERLARPGAARAVGQAMRRNPQPVITPCHRVVGSSGRLHGYAGSGDDGSRPLAIKRYLLRLERGDPADASVGR